MSDIRKVAIVTGASQGLGEGIAQAFLQKGYRVVGTSRSIAPSSNADLITIAADVGDPATGPMLVAAALARFGRVDTLVNNAGIFVASPMTDYTEDQYRQNLRTNLDGFFFTTQAVIPTMLKQGGGHIVQITASLVDHANAKAPSVVAAITKGGLDAATRSLAIEYAGRGIRVNAVAPGIIKTPMNPANTHATLAAFHPLNRMGEVSDIAQAVLYLEDATFVTGETLRVDGGMAAGH